MLEGYSTNTNRDNDKNVPREFEYKQEGKSKRKMSTINLHFRRQSITKEENIETLKQTIRLFTEKKALLPKESLIKSLSEDKLVTNLMQENHFKIPLDITFQNKPTNRIKLLYYLTESPFNWTFVHSIKNTLKQYATYQFEEVVSGCQKAEEISVNTYGMTNWSNDLKDFDVLFMKDYLTCAYDLKDLWRAVKDDGVLLLHETTTKHGILENLKNVFSVPTNGKYFKQLSFNEITKIIEENGWRIVFERYDNIFSSLILCKKKLPNILKPIILPFNDYKNFEWVDELKKLMEDTKSNKDTRIWLIGDKDYRNGIIGFLNSLRQEPDGDKVR